MMKNLKEEIGRNQHTADTDPYQWDDDPDLDIEVYATVDGDYSVKVKSISRPDLSSDLRKFPDEPSATFYARQQADRIRRITLNELRQVVRSILLN